MPYKTPPTFGKRNFFWANHLFALDIISNIFASNVKSLKSFSLLGGYPSIFCCCFFCVSFFLVFFSSIWNPLSVVGEKEKKWPCEKSFFISCSEHKIQSASVPFSVLGKMIANYGKYHNVGGFWSLCGEPMTKIFCKVGELLDPWYVSEMPWYSNLSNRLYARCLIKSISSQF